MCAGGYAKGGRGVVERKSRWDVLRIDEGENDSGTRTGTGRKRVYEERGWVEGIISPMQIAFGLRLTEYTLELPRRASLDRCIFRGRARAALPCVRTLLKEFHHREPRLVTFAIRETKSSFFLRCSNENV